MEPFTLVFDVSIQGHYEAPGSYQESFKCSEWLFPNLSGWTIPWETANVSHNMMIDFNTQSLWMLIGQKNEPCTFCTRNLKLYYEFKNTNNLLRTGSVTVYKIIIPIRIILF